MQKISRDQELLEPLIPTCRSCLEHRHSYVRKNAVFAVYTIYREFEQLIPDAPELIETFLAAESDATCKRNAFVFLSNCAMSKAVQYIVSVLDQIPGMDELLQMSIIEVIRLDCKGDTSHKVSDIPSGAPCSVPITALAALYPTHLRAPQCVVSCSQVRSSYDIDIINAESRCSER